MDKDVSAWRQSGSLYVWRYATPGRSRQGWHFTADPAGCASIIDLIDRMVAGGVSAHRTLTLAKVTDRIWGVPNFGPPKTDRFEKLRFTYQPDADEMTLAEHDGRLDLGLGIARTAGLKAAFADVGIGEGDFGVGTSDRRLPEIWYFWWMPRDGS